MSDTQAGGQLAYAAARSVDENLNVHSVGMSDIVPEPSSLKVVGLPDTGFLVVCQAVAMTNLETIGQRIAGLRKGRGLSQIELSAELGIARSTLAGIERGIDRGGIMTMVAIADYLKVPMDWLLGRPAPTCGPLAGQIIDDADELAWLKFWRSLDDEQRRTLLRTLVWRTHGTL